MRKITEVLRLRFGLRLGQDQIARSCSIGQATVHRYLERATAAGLAWPLPEEYDDRRLNETAVPDAAGVSIFSATPRSGLRRLPPAVTDQQTCHPAIAVGRVSRDASGRLPLQPFLRTVSAMEPESGCRPPAGPQSRREDDGRLGRPYRRNS